MNAAAVLHHTIVAMTTVYLLVVLLLPYLPLLSSRSWHTLFVLCYHLVNILYYKEGGPRRECMTTLTNIFWCITASRKKVAAMHRKSTRLVNWDFGCRQSTNTVYTGRV